MGGPYPLRGGPPDRSGCGEDPSLGVLSTEISIGLWRGPPQGANFVRTGANFVRTGANFVRTEPISSEQAPISSERERTWLSGLVGPASASSGGGGMDQPRTMPNGPHQGEASLLLAHATEGALSVAMVPPRGGGQGHQARQGRRARGRGSRSVAEPCSAAAMVPQVASSDGAAAWSSGGVQGGPARRARASSLALDSQPRADDAARAALDDGETSSSSSSSTSSSSA